MPTYYVAPGSEGWVKIQRDVLKVFSRASLLRATVLANGQVLIGVNTKREYGTFATLLWTPLSGVMHSGHYFDLVSEAITDYAARGGNLEESIQKAG